VDATRALISGNTAVEIWWQDEARVRQEMKLTLRLVPRGRRATAPKDRRTKSAYIFGVICPTMTPCSCISSQVAPGAHAVLIIDHAGRHIAGKLISPSNITLLPLPPRKPGSNPIETVWQFIRDNWLSSRVFGSYDEIVALCCETRNKRIDQRWKIMSTGR
jgi:hypothetical protein